MPVEIPENAEWPRTRVDGVASIWCSLKPIWFYSYIEKKILTGIFLATGCWSSPIWLTNVYSFIYYANLSTFRCISLLKISSFIFVNICHVYPGKICVLIINMNRKYMWLMISVLLFLEVQIVRHLSFELVLPLSIHSMQIVAWVTG